MRLRRQYFILTLIVTTVVSFFVYSSYFLAERSFVSTHKLKSKMALPGMDDEARSMKGKNTFTPAPSKTVNLTLEEYRPQCVDPHPTNKSLAEDIFCLERPIYLPNYKNPCWYEEIEEKVFQLNCLPYFQVLGVDKSGSTDLFGRITEHPQVLPNTGALGKETYFWCWTRVGVWMKKSNIHENFRTLLSYSQEFFGKAADEIEQNSRANYHGLITGDGTPMDFWDMRGWLKLPQNKGLQEPVVLTPHLMKHVYRDPKFIVIFRDPTDRLYSDYYFLDYGTTPESFHKDAERAVEMMRDCFHGNGSQRLCIFDSTMYARLTMRIHIGCYSVFLKEWLAVFPKENFLFLKTEEYDVSMKETLRRVFAFLELDLITDDLLESLARKGHRHITQRKLSKGPMLNETKKLLDDFYAPFKKEMADILQDDRWLWKRPLK